MGERQRVVIGSAGRALATASVGERWVIRYRLPDGSATDVVGWLEELRPESLQVATSDGRLQRIDRSAVVVARKAPAAAGGGDPRRIGAADLERIALPGWLAQHEPLGEWTLRAAGGFTGRANSCLAVGVPGMPLERAAARIIGYAADHGISPLAQVVTGSAEDAALRGLGWHDTYVPTQVLAVRLNDLLGGDPVHPAVRLTETLTDGWLVAYQQSRPATADFRGDAPPNPPLRRRPLPLPEKLPLPRTRAADPALLRMILDGNPPRAFASVSDDTTDPAASITGGQDPRSAADDPALIPFAIARGHLSRDWLGVASIWTRADRRRQGRATAMLRGLGHWAARRSARYCYLQVASANIAAITAYERLGFVRHHRYHYLAPPDPV